MKKNFNNNFKIKIPERSKRNEMVFVNSAFTDTGLTEYLKSKNEKQVMIVGIQKDYSMDITVKCGFEHGRRTSYAVKK